MQKYINKLLPLSLPLLVPQKSGGGGDMPTNVAFVEDRESHGTAYIIIFVSEWTCFGCFGWAKMRHSPPAIYRGNECGYFAPYSEPVRNAHCSAAASIHSRTPFGPCFQCGNSTPSNPVFRTHSSHAPPTCANSVRRCFPVAAVSLFPFLSFPRKQRQKRPFFFFTAHALPSTPPSSLTSAVGFSVDIRAQPCPLLRSLLLVLLVLVTIPLYVVSARVLPLRRTALSRVHIVINRVSVIVRVTLTSFRTVALIVMISISIHS